MGAPTAGNVEIGYTGGVYRAAVGTTSPNNATTALPSDWKELGYMTDAGLELNWYDQNNTILRAWQENSAVRTLTSESTSTVAFTALETNSEVSKAFHGDSNVAAGHTTITTEAGVRGPWVIEVKDGTKRRRYVILDAQVTTREAQNVQNAEAITYGFTLTCFPVNGVVAHEYSIDLATSS